MGAPPARAAAHAHNAADRSTAVPGRSEGTCHTARDPPGASTTVPAAVGLRGGRGRAVKRPLAAATAGECSLTLLVQLRLWQALGALTRVMLNLTGNCTNVSSVHLSRWLWLN